MSEEVKEWLDVKPADFLVYFALGAVGALYIVKSNAFDTALSLAAVGACIVACRWGMRTDVRVSPFTNLVKKVSYPLCLLGVLVCVYLNFHSWNG